MGKGVSFTHYSNKDGFFSKVINSIFQDSKGLMWFSARDGLTKFDGHTFYKYSAKDGVPYTSIGSVNEDSSGNIWIGSDRGMLLLKNGKARKA